MSSARRPRRHRFLWASLLVVGCSSGGETVFEDDDVRPRAATSAAEPGATTVPVGADDSATGPGADVAPGTDAPTTTATAPLVIDRASSPENAVAELVGSGADPSTVTDASFTVDGEPADVVDLEVADDGGFVARLSVLVEGPHTVCILDVCARVFTRALESDTPEEVAAKIAEAREAAALVFDGESEFPDWSIEIGDAQAGVGGSTDVASRTITINAARDRTVEEFVVTVLHEWGHVVDAERLDDAERARIRELRGFAADEAWSTPGVHTIENWRRQPAEDFAEVMIALWTSETPVRHEVRTDAPAGQPDIATLERIAELVAG